MRKEILIATIAGIIIGLLVAFGSWRANLALKEKSPDHAGQDLSANSKEKPNPTNSQKSEDLTITLTDVEDYDVLTDSKLKISGITKPNSLVAFSAEKEDFILKSASDGSFEQEIELISGVNQILLSAFSSQGEQTEKRLTVVYSAEFGKDISTINQ